MAIKQGTNISKLEFVQWAKRMGYADEFDVPLMKHAAQEGWNAREPEIAELLTALRNLHSYADRNTCYHEETHRGGAIWEICDSCGAKWADDEGGKPAFVEPKELKAAAEILDKYSKVKS